MQCLALPLLPISLEKVFQLGVPEAPEGVPLGKIAGGHTLREGSFGNKHFEVAIDNKIVVGEADY